MVILKTKTGMIPANETEVLFTDVDIEDESIIEVYYDSNDVYTVETSQTGNTVLVVVSEHANPVGVKLLINNVTSFSPYDDSDIVQHLGLVDQTLTTISSELNERVPQDTVLGGVLYHSNTGNMWKKLDATNLNYDDESTLYSAMGDIDSLETTSKNLVGAINEVKSSGGGSDSVEILYNQNTCLLTRCGHVYTFIISVNNYMIDTVYNDIKQYLPDTNMRIIVADYDNRNVGMLLLSTLRCTVVDISSWTPRTGLFSINGQCTWIK